MLYPVKHKKMAEKEKGNHTLFERFANGVAWFTSTSWAFTGASFLIIIWLGSGFAMHFGDFWLGIIGAITSVITFLMVFIIQKTQNKESKAIHLKLNELLAASTHASNRLVGIEELPEEELEKIYEHFRTVVELSYKKSNFNVSHSIEKTMDEMEGNAGGETQSPEETDTAGESAEPEEVDTVEPVKAGLNQHEAEEESGRAVRNAIGQVGLS